MEEFIVVGVEFLQKYETFRHSEYETRATGPKPDPLLALIRLEAATPHSLSFLRRRESGIS